MHDVLLAVTVAAVSVLAVLAGLAHCHCTTCQKRRGSRGRP